MSNNSDGSVRMKADLAYSSGLRRNWKKIVQESFMKCKPSNAPSAPSILFPEEGSSLRS